MKNSKLIMLLIFACFFLIPFKVSANSNGCNGVEIVLEDIVFGGTGQKTTFAEGGIHFVTPTINITWYESSNGVDYTLMEENATFDDYNVYYKAVLDTSYDELNGGFDEGWELCGLSIKIVDENHNTVGSKSYNSSSNLEYVFDPFWKYNVYLQLTDYAYTGPSEVLEGDGLIAQLVPKKNYRLPFDYEAYTVKIIIGSKEVGGFDNETGNIEILPRDLNGDIFIYANALEMEKVDFESKDYIYTKYNVNSSLNLDVAIGNVDKLYINDKEITGNYYYDTSDSVLMIDENLLDTFDVGTYSLRIENKEKYAESTFEVRELESVDKITIDFRKISNSSLLTADQLAAFQFLGIDKAYLTFDVSLVIIGDINQKILLYVDADNNITLADNLSSKDNIIYTLTDEEMELYKEDYAETQIPKKIVMIFSDYFEVALDANGGKFIDSDKYIVNDIANFDYVNFKKPTRDGYRFIGFFTKKTGGKSFEEVMNSEAGIESDMIFYARWEKVEANPKTFDGIGTSIFMGTISLIGLIGATIYLKKKNKVRAN